MIFFILGCYVGLIICDIFFFEKLGTAKAQALHYLFLSIITIIYAVSLGINEYAKNGVTNKLYFIIIWFILLFYVCIRYLENYRRLNKKP